MNGLRSTPSHHRSVSAGGIFSALLVAILSVYSQRTALPEPPPEPPTAHVSPIPKAFQPGKSRIKAFGARFSPDGTLLVVLNDPSAYHELSNGISLFDVRTGRMLWQDQSVHVAHVKFSADGKTIACDQTAGEKPDTNGDFEVELRDARTGKPFPGRQKFPLRDGYLGGFALSPDGKQIALSGSPYSLARLLDTATGKVVRTFGTARDAHRLFCYDIAYSPDGRYIAARPYNNCPNYGLDCPLLLVFEAATGRVVYANADPEYHFPSGVFTSIPVCFDPTFFVTDKRLVYGNSVLDLDGPSPISPRPMISESDTRPDSGGYRLFVGFVDDPSSKAETRAPHTRLALFRMQYFKDDRKGEGKDVERFEVWDIETRKRVRVVLEQDDTGYYVLDYSPTARLFARLIHRAHDFHILTLERL